MTHNVPDNESRRLAALNAYDILDSSPEASFDDIALLASQICGTPIAAISLIDDHRQWFKASVGLHSSETPREDSFCQYTVAAGEMFVVSDASTDERVKDSPLVRAGQKICFYAGAPLITPAGYTVGALCVKDTKPRTLTHEQLAGLECLANQVVSQMELRSRNQALTDKAVKLKVRTRQLRAAASIARASAKIALCNMEALSAFQERSRAILASTLDALVTLDANGIIVGWDGRASEIFGLDAGYAIGLSFSQMIFPSIESPKDFREITSTIEIQHGLRLNRGEAVVLHTSGARIPVELSVAETKLKGEDAYILFLRDLTDKHAAESALHDSEELLRLHVEQAADAIFLIDDTGRFLTVNAEACRSLGYDREELTSMWIWDIEVGNTAEGIRDNLQTSEGGHVQTIDSIQRRKDGTTFPAEVTLSCFIRDQHHYAIAISRDISERQRAVEALRESEERFSLVAKATDDVIWDLDVSTGISWWSDNYYLAFAPESPGTPGSFDLWVSHLHPDDADRVVASMDTELYGDTEQWNCEYRYRKPDGTYADVFDRAFIIRSEGKAIRLIGAMSDISSRKRAQEDELAREQAEKANRAKSEFLSRMSHELRTPLNAVIGFAQLLEMSEPTPQQSECLEHILNAGKHLLGLINEVLDLSRIETGTLPVSREPVGVLEVLMEAINLVRPLTLQHKIEIKEVSSVAPDRFVFADRQRLLQIFINLLGNAIKYNREAGWVEIECEACGDNLKITVADSGRGISPQFMSRAFMPFDRLGAESNTNIEGTGLGLALSKSLVESMGGSIDVASTVGVGSIFSLQLPQAACPSVACQDELSTLDVTTLSRATKVLYIEDNISNLLLMQHIMNTAPQIELIVAKTGWEGISRAEQEVPDIVLLDLDLPDISGLEVLEQLKANEKLCHIPVLVVSADATKSRITRLLNAGAAGYVVKPFEIRDLLGQISDLDTFRGVAVA